MPALPISICLISGAEAARIDRALASVADWAAEIVVVLNAEVQDGTEEICRARGARVYREEWKGHVAQKNSAAEKATQPWILGLDADEVVTPELREDIAGIVGRESPGPEICAYSCPRMSMFAGRWIRHGDWYPDRKVRLWRRGKARWGGINPHDRIESDGPVGRLRGHLLHYSYENLNHQLSKIRAYSDDFVRERRLAGRGFSLVEAVVRPPWRFFRGYVLRLGFLDGWAGFTIAVMVAFLTFVKYAKLAESSTPAVPPHSAP
jgi:glycosyltransferase involved in cell wall biosynthesis